MLEFLEPCTNFGSRISTFGFRVLLAAEAPADAKGDANLRLLYTGLLLVGGLLVAAVLIAWAQRWARRMTGDSTSDSGVGSFRESFERGELTEEEYKRILNRMGGAKSPSPARPERISPPMNSPTSDGRTPETPAAE